MRLDTHVTLDCRTGRPLVTVTRDTEEVRARLADVDGTRLLDLTGRTRHEIAERLEDAAEQVRNARSWPPTIGVCEQPLGDGSVCELATHHDGRCDRVGVPLSRLEQHASDRKDVYEDEYGPRRRVELDRAINGDTA